MNGLFGIDFENHLHLADRHRRRKRIQRVVEELVGQHGGVDHGNEEVEYTCPRIHRDPTCDSRASFNRKKAVWRCPCCGFGGGLDQLEHELALAVTNRRLRYGSIR